MRDTTNYPGFVVIAHDPSDAHSLRGALQGLGYATELAEGSWQGTVEPCIIAYDVHPSSVRSLAIMARHAFGQTCILHVSEYPERQAETVGPHASEGHDAIVGTWRTIRGNVQPAGDWTRVQRNGKYTYFQAQK